MQFKDNRHKKKRKDLKIFKKRHYKPEKPNPGAAPEESSEDSDDSDDSDGSGCKKSFSRRPIENNWARYEEPEPIVPKKFEDRRRTTADANRQEIAPSERAPRQIEGDRHRKAPPEVEGKWNAGQNTQPKRESRQAQSTEKPQPQRQSKANQSFKGDPKPQRQAGTTKHQSKNVAGTGQSHRNNQPQYDKSGSSKMEENLEIDTKLSNLGIRGNQKEEENIRQRQYTNKLEPSKPEVNPNSKEDLQQWLDNLLDE